MFRTILALTVIALTAAAPDRAATAQDQRAALRGACKADYDRLCTGVRPGGGRIIQCLRENADKLSPDCKAALDQRGSRKPE